VLSRKIGQQWLDDGFDEVVCSAEVGMIKPSPDIYKLTAAKLGVDPSECVFIDDHRSFVEAAEGVGMQGIVYKDLSDLKMNLDKVL
jgi:putative hydrolase of the HAD superfamily